jgi:hypothetical protein
MIAPITAQVSIAKIVSHDKYDVGLHWLLAAQEGKK